MISLAILFVYFTLLAWKRTRCLAFYMLPWVIFGLCYDVMRFYPNYKVNPIDIKNIYNTEKELFGITTSQGILIPGEWFKLHTSSFFDFMAGIFYLCWVPVPLFFSFYLFYKKEYDWTHRFTWSFLVVNLVGFMGYYIHPTAPPWYIDLYGFEPILNTPGNPAGLIRWDKLTGIYFYSNMYGNNSNVFAAIPSLHAAYLLVTTIYSIMSKRRWYASLTFGILCIGIWWTAVYTQHHYVIDVLLGIFTTIIGILLFEGGRKIMRNNIFL